MIPFKELCGLAAVLFSILASSSYLVSVLRRRTRPHAISWLIWAILMTVAFLGQVKEGSGPGSWPTAVGAVQAAFIFLLAIRQGDLGIYRFDWICLALAAIAFAAYHLCTDAVFAIAFATLADSLGYLPTLKKTTRNPASEDIKPWLCYVVSALLTLAAIRNYNLATVLYPAATAAMNLWIFYILFSFGRRRRLLERSS